MPDVIVGAGHNGLVAACYLARAGGILGTPGRMAARALLHDCRRR